MSKLVTFENMQTKWEGLWWHSEYNGFSSAVIDLSVMRKFKGNVRLYIRKNKFYNNGENGRPNYHFCLKDAQSETPKMLDVDDQNNRQGENDDVPRDKDGNRLYTEEEVYRVIHGMQDYHGLPPGDDLIEDFL